MGFDTRNLAAFIQSSESVSINNTVFDNDLSARSNIKDNSGERKEQESEIGLGSIMRTGYQWMNMSDKATQPYIIQ